MSTQHTRRIHAVVSDAARAQVNAVVVTLLGPGYDGCLAVPLSPTGDEPATHWACSAQVTEAERDAVLALLDPDSGVAGARGWAAGVDTDAPLVREGEPVPPDVPAGDIRWTFRRLLEELGLRRIERGIGE